MRVRLLIWLGWMICTVCFIFSSAAFAGMTFQETFNGQLNQWKEHGGCYNYSFAIVQDPCTDSVDNRVVQITNRMGEDNRVCPDAPWNKPLAGTNNKAFKHRAELIPANTATRVEPGQDFWVGMRSFIAKTYPSGNSLINFHITQIIPPPYDGPDMVLQITTKGSWMFTVRRTPAVAPRNDLKVNLGMITRGKWTDWVIHFKRSTGKDGVAQVWKDGKLEVNYKGVTSQSNEPKGLWKLGLYRGKTVQSKHLEEEYKIYFDDVKIAVGPKQYETVRPDETASKCLATVARPKPPEDLSVLPIK